MSLLKAHADDEWDEITCSKTVAAEVAESVEVIRSIVRRQVAMGADMIKLYAGMFSVDFTWVTFLLL